MTPGQETIDAHLGGQIEGQRPGKVDEAALGGAVAGAVANRVNAEVRRYVNDVAAVGAQLRQCRLHAEEGALENDIDMAVPKALIPLLERTFDVDPCVVDENVEAPEMLDRRRDRVFAARDRRDVGGCRGKTITIADLSDRAFRDVMRLAELVHYHADVQFEHPYPLDGLPVLASAASSTPSTCTKWPFACLLLRTGWHA